MDITTLPFDTDAMLAGLRPWVECESPTFDAARVNAMMDLVSRECVASGAKVERISGRMGFGDCARATFSFGHESKPGILLLGHLDTVHPVGTLAKLPWRRDGERCYGPGIFDMKGGNFIALEAIRMLQRLVSRPALPVTFLFTSDEEVGSPEHARTHRSRGSQAQIRAGAGARPRRRRRRHRPLRDRALQSQGHRPAEPCRCAAEGRTLGHPHHGRHDPADRRDDHGCLHVQRRRGAWRPMGELRRKRLRGRGAQHGEAPGRSRWRRRAHAGADQRRRTV
jgi:hypothetical protein